MAIASLAFIPYNFPPLYTFQPKLVLFFIMFIAGILLIVNVKKNWPFQVYWNKKEYVQTFKKTIIEKIIGFVDKNLAYEPQKYIGPDLFLDSGIFRISLLNTGGMTMLVELLATFPWLFPKFMHNAE